MEDLGGEGAAGIYDSRIPQIYGATLERVGFISCELQLTTQRLYGPPFPLPYSLTPHLAVYRGPLCIPCPCRLGPLKELGEQP
jgi:hypothetical protein